MDYLRGEWNPLDKALAADLKALRDIGPGEASVNTRTLDDKT